MKYLHPGARWLFRVRAYIILFFVIGTFSGLFLQLFAAVSMRGYWGYEGIDLSQVAMLLAIQIILMISGGEIYARMAYNRWKYEFTDTNLKTERGIIWKKYSNVPYDRVQNVDIHRGILARVFGFSSLHIQTAGFHYSGRGMPASEGNIPAVSMHEAEQIRTFLMKKISKSHGGV